MKLVKRLSILCPEATAAGVNQGPGQAAGPATVRVTFQFSFEDSGVSVQHHA